MEIWQSKAAVTPHSIVFLTIIANRTFCLQFPSRRAVRLCLITKFLIVSLWGFETNESAKVDSHEIANVCRKWDLNLNLLVSPNCQNFNYRDEIRVSDF